MTATAPGKLILTGEYAVLDGAPAVVIAVDRRVVASMRGPVPAGSSPFLLAVARELGNRYGDAAAQAALGIVVDSSAFYAGSIKLGLGSSAAVTVAATQLALELAGISYARPEVLAVASAAHANAQGARGARGSGADIAAAVHGGTIRFARGVVSKLFWPQGITLLPFFTGTPADTAALVTRVTAARTANRVAVDAAMVAVTDASQAATLALRGPRTGTVTAVVGAFTLAAIAIDRLAVATGVDLVPDCVRAARSAMAVFGGTAKTTGAGGGDIGVAVIPTTTDVTRATRALIECGCQPLQLSVDEAGVDLRPGAS